MNKLLEQIAVTAELMGQAISPTAAAVMAKDLQAYPASLVVEALTRVRRESKGRFTLAAVIEQLDRLQPDGRPGVEEAWAMIPKDEHGSVVMTEEMAEAYGIAAPLLNEGEATAARMAFKEAYARIVERNKLAGVSPKWFPSLGRDKEMRTTVLQEAVRLGRIGVEHAERIVPADILNLPDHTTRLAIEDKTPVSHEQAVANIARLRLMLGSSRIGKSS